MNCQNMYLAAVSSASAFVVLSCSNSSGASIEGYFPDTVVTIIDVSMYTRDVYSLPNGEHEYVANLCCDNIYLIRTSENTIIKTLMH